MSRFGLVAFVNARLDEDEATARAAYCKGPSFQQPTAPPEGSWWTSAQIMRGLGLGTWNDAQHITRHDPSRVLREVEAKRARLALLDEAITEMDRLLADDDAEKIDQGVAIGRKEAALTAVKHDAAVYNDHPDYQADWKP